LTFSGLIVLRVRYLLSFSSYRTVLDLIEQSKTHTRFEKQDSPRLFVWAVEHTAKLVPAASCLTKALALRWLLAKSGQQCTIRIGVNKADNGAVEAHAWVIQNGEVLIGGSGAEQFRFVPIVDL